MFGFQLWFYLIVIIAVVTVLDLTTFWVRRWVR